MSLFPRFPQQNEFAPIFRLLDDYDSHRSSSSARTQSHIRAFQPKFDVRELPAAYELHGELPGIDQNAIDLEFSDPHTLVVKGRVERTYEAGNNAAGQKSLKATVEDEAGSASEGGDGKDVAKANGKDGSKGKGKGDEATYWVSERSVGEFHRSFSFPSRVDQDAVKAKLENGILTVTVPKATAQKAKKISIE